MPSTWPSVSPRSNCDRYLEVAPLLFARVGRCLALPVTALVAVVVATLVMWVVMALVAHRGSRARGAGGLLNDMVTRFMGLIVIAMGVQFALTGFHNFFG